MVAKYEAAARHRPIAHGRGKDTSAGADRNPDPRRELRHGSETRLQAAVVADRKRDEKDPYADVPCTD
jgi:hypothetical protein